MIEQYYILGLLISTILAYYTYNDAKKRYKDSSKPAVWSILVFLFPILIIIYLLVRPEEKAEGEVTVSEQTTIEETTTGVKTETVTVTEPDLILNVSYPNVATINDSIELEIETNLPSTVDLSDALQAFKPDETNIYVDGHKTVKLRPLKLGKHRFKVVATHDGKTAEVTVEIEVKRLCPNCGAEIDELLNVCPHCGATIEKICPQCGTTLDPSWRTCSVCGYTERSTRIYAKETKCPRCGIPIDPSWTSCPKCGEKLACVCSNPDPSWVYCPVCGRRLK